MVCWGGGGIDSVLASHPAAPEANLSSAKIFSSLLLSSWTVEIEI